jgi:hypothetical protein
VSRGYGDQSTKTLPGDIDEFGHRTSYTGSLSSGGSVRQHRPVAHYITRLIPVVLLVSCTTTGPTDFDEYQCRLLRQRGVNTSNLCRRPPSASKASNGGASEGASAGGDGGAGGGGAPNPPVGGGNPPLGGGTTPPTPEPPITEPPPTGGGGEPPPTGGKPPGGIDSVKPPGTPGDSGGKPDDNGDRPHART